MAPAPGGCSVWGPLGCSSVGTRPGSRFALCGYVTFWRCAGARPCPCPSLWVGWFCPGPGRAVCGVAAVRQRFLVQLGPRGVLPPRLQGWLWLTGCLGACWCAWPAQGQASTAAFQRHPFFLSLRLAALTSGFRKS